MPPEIPVYPADDARIGHHLAEWLLLRTMEDLEVRCRPGSDTYTLLGLSPLLRKLLTDHRPLVNGARARLQLPAPEFSFTPFEYPADEDTPEFRLLVGFAQDDFMTPTTTTGLKGFLNATIGYHRQDPVTVRNVIRYFANTHGGVHAGTPDPGFEREVQRFTVSSDLMATGWMQSLVRISAVTLRALEPVATAIRADPTSP